MYLPDRCASSPQATQEPVSSVPVFLFQQVDIKYVLNTMSLPFSDDDDEEI